MPRRFGRPGLLGTMARTAVIAGTANATANAMNRRQAGRMQAAADQQAAQQMAADSSAQMAQMQAQLDAMSAPAAPSAPAAGGDDLMAKLTQLGDLHSSGVLTDAEFAAAKAKLLS